MTMYVQAVGITVSFADPDNPGDHLTLTGTSGVQILPLWAAELPGFARLWAAGQVHVSESPTLSPLIYSIPSSELPASQVTGALSATQMGVFPLGNYTNLQAAITACNAAGGGVVQLPQGPVSCSAQINMLSNVVLRGVPGEWSVTTPHTPSWLEFDTSTTNPCVNIATTCVQAGLRDVSITGVGATTAPATRNAINIASTTLRNGNHLRNVMVYGGNIGVYVGARETRMTDINILSAAGDGIQIDAGDCSLSGNILTTFCGGNGVTLTANSSPIRMDMLDTGFSGGRGLDINGNGHRLHQVNSNNNNMEGVRFYSATDVTVTELFCADNGRQYTGTAPNTTRYANLNFAHPTAGNSGCAILGGQLSTTDTSSAPLMLGNVISTESAPGIPMLTNLTLFGWFYYSGSANNGPYAQLQAIDDFVVTSCSGAPDNHLQQSGLPFTFRDYGSGIDQTQWASSSGSVYAGIKSKGALYLPTVSIPLASNGAVTIDASAGNDYVINLSANATSSTITNPTVGQWLTIKWTQTTASNTYVWPTNCYFLGSAPTPSSALGSADVVTFVYDGTNWRERSRSGTATTTAAQAGVWRPSDHGLIAWAYDPSVISSTYTLSAGLLYVVGLKIGAATSVTNILLDMQTAGSGLTSGQNFAALYQGGTLLGTTADQTTNWAGTAGIQVMALSGGAKAVTAGLVYVAFFSNGTTKPTFAAGSSYGNNQGLTSGGHRYGYANNGTTYTTAPPGTITATAALTVGMWAAVS